ncbi:hypothetical protein BH10PLA1_BH10PLA1_11190 [soil metagenome]
MPSLRGMNRHQKRFFRKLRLHPKGLPASAFPSPIVMARWLAQPRFCERLEATLEVQRVVGAMRSLIAAVDILRRVDVDSPDAAVQVRAALTLLNHGEINGRLPVRRTPARMGKR